MLLFGGASEPSSCTLVEDVPVADQGVLGKDECAAARVVVRMYGVNVDDCAELATQDSIGTCQEELAASRNPLVPAEVGSVSVRGDEASVRIDFGDGTRDWKARKEDGNWRAEIPGTSGGIVPLNP